MSTDGPHNPDDPWLDHTSTVTHQMPLMPVGPPTRRSPSVVVVSGYGLGSIFRLTGEPITIGRDPTNVIAVEDVGVSRRHATIERLGEQVVVRDLGSKNGTYVNDDLVTQAVLEDGDLVHVGHSTYKFLAGDNLEYGYYEGLHNVASQDRLTELPNRRYFDEVLEREVARARRYDSCVFLLLADIDHFKRINDTWGHLAGDTVLREFARIVRKRVRKSEFLARYGGEEFAFVLPGATRSDAMIFAEAVREIVASNEFVFGEETISVTVSIGGAVFEPGMAESSMLIEAADEKLYEAKRSGRNKVCM